MKLTRKTTASHVHVAAKGAATTPAAAVEVAPTATPTASVSAAGRPRPAAQATELAAHAQRRGVASAGVAVSVVVDAIVAAELAEGQALDVRVTPTDMQRAVGRAAQALVMQPHRQSALFGFTRVVDRKLQLTGALLQHLCAQLDSAQLTAAIASGPPSGEWVWAAPTTPLQLVASLVRQIVRGGGASRQIVMSPEVHAWFDSAIAAALHLEGASMTTAMGGAGAFAANLAQTLDNVDARFFSSAPLPQAIADRFAPGVRVVDGGGITRKLASFINDAPARINTAVEYREAMAFEVANVTQLDVGGVLLPLVASGSGRVILGTQAKDIKPGFDDVTDDSLRTIASQTDLFFNVGAHYLTQGTHDEAKASAAALARSFDVMHAQHPALLIHMQYVTAKAPDNEATVLRELRGHIDSFALNAVEVAPLVATLNTARLTALHIDADTPHSAAEDPEHMLAGALAIVDALKLRRVHLHGFDGDLVVADADVVGGADPQRQRLALLRARQLASNKAANPSGEIKAVDDVWSVPALVMGCGLAALHRFADVVAHRYALTDAQRDGVVRDWYFVDPATQRTIHFVPTRGIHERSGGTVSLGDTIDAAALMFALKPKARGHLQQGAVPMSFGSRGR